MATPAWMKEKPKSDKSPYGPPKPPVQGPPKPPTNKPPQQQRPPALPPDDRGNYPPPAWVNRAHINPASNQTPLTFGNSTYQYTNPNGYTIGVMPQYQIGGQFQGSAPFFQAQQTMEQLRTIPGSTTTSNPNAAPWMQNIKLTPEQKAMRDRSQGVTRPLTLTMNPLNYRPRITNGLITQGGEGGMPVFPDIKVTQPLSSGGSSSSGYSGYGYGGRGYGGGGWGGGYGYDGGSAARTASWMMNLYNWNFKG
jgi:hypothetical protein